MRATVVRVAAATAVEAKVTAAVVRAGAVAKGVAAKEMAATAAVGTVGLYLDLEGSDDVHAWWRHRRALYMTKCPMHYAAGRG